MYLRHWPSQLRTHFESVYSECESARQGVLGILIECLLLSDHCQIMIGMQYILQAHTVCIIQPSTFLADFLDFWCLGVLTHEHFIPLQSRAALSLLGFCYFRLQDFQAAVEW